MEKIPDIIHPSWHEYLQPLFDDRKMKLIKTDLLVNCKFYPEPSQIFRVFSMPLNEIKVVILGQDPYPNGEAIGFAFAVKSSTPIPGSLKVIKSEIINSRVERDTYINIESDKWRTLYHWTQQKVFLLNTALTVEAKAAGSHVGVWNWFSREVIKIISSKTVNRPVWLLWGAKAQAFKDYIQSGIVWKKDSDTAQGLVEFNAHVNYLLNAPHPAAELYPSSRNATFSGCNHFKYCNQILKSKGQSIINW